MPTIDWRELARAAQERARRLPRWTWFAAAGLVLTLVLFFALVSGGPSYSPLYEGLSAKQGGQVIDKLQKLGITYRLNSSGSIISVPANDLARARLKLGKMGVPESSGNQAWDELTKGSLTTSQTAEDALSKRALEDSLEQAIAGISGVASDRVTLALPKSTPFLKSQPHPKASVWLRTTSAGVSPTQARAIAQMVANSVPGLDTRHVTVTDQDGNVLAPASSQGLGQAQQQLQFQSQFEALEARHIQALLTPLIGEDNFRVSTSASIDFATVEKRGEQYGPRKQVSEEKRQVQNQNGALNGAVGVPGALSNQPPGKATAPTKVTGSGKAGGSAASNSAKGSKKRKSPASKGGSKSKTPHSSDDKWDVDYDVDHITTVTHEAPWRLKALSVSVVVNQAAVGKHAQWVSQVRQMIKNAIAAPNLKVNVATVPFGLQKAPKTHSRLQNLLANHALVQALMELLAAVLILLGIARPLARWISEAMPVPSFAGYGRLSSQRSQSGEEAAPSVDKRATGLEDKQWRAGAVASQRPEEAAEMLKRWIEGSSDTNSGDVREDSDDRA